MSDKDYKAISRTRIIEFPLLPDDKKAQYLKACPDFARVGLLRLIARSR